MAFAFNQHRERLLCLGQSLAGHVALSHCSDPIPLWDDEPTLKPSPSSLPPLPPIPAQGKIDHCIFIDVMNTRKKGGRKKCCHRNIDTASHPQHWGRAVRPHPCAAGGLMGEQRRAQNWGTQFSAPPCQTQHHLHPCIPQALPLPCPHSLLCLSIRLSVHPPSRSPLTHRCVPSARSPAALSALSA